MTTNGIERDFREKVCAEIRLLDEGMDRYRVFTPFQFDDGDHLAIVLKREGDQWLLSDEGHTFMHLTYQVDEKELQRGTRQKVIGNALSAFGIEDREGELLFRISDDRYGDALYSFSQALLKIADVTFLSRERVKSTFMEDFRQLLEEAVPEGRREFDWNDPLHDPQRKYIVDCRVNGMARPLFVFGLPNDDRTRDSMISMLQFERWGVSYRSLAIFEDQEEINRKVLARFSDICEKQFSSIGTNRERIAKYLQETFLSSQ